MYSKVYDDNDDGIATLDVPFPEILQNTNWQIAPAEGVTEWTVVISARLDASLPWVPLRTVDHQDNAGDRIVELAAYPHYQVEVSDYDGTGNVVVGASYAPSIASVVTRQSMPRELAALTAPPNED